MSAQLGNIDRTGLQSLAIELLYNICEQASLSSSGRKNTHALCRMRLVCKQLDFAVQLLLFVDVDLSTMKESLQLETTRSQLQMLANRNSAACRLSKSLTIRCGDLFSPSLPARITSWDNWKSADDIEIGLTKQALTLWITPTITSLYQTRKVRWVVGHYEPHSNIVAILYGLRYLPNLEDLTIELSRAPEDEFPLSWLSNLRFINISWRCTEIPTLFIHQLSQLIQQSPNLSRLDIRAVHKSARTLQQLFSGCSNPLQLEHLSLRGLCVTPDDFKSYALPHLKVLKSFSLTENTYIAPGGRDKFVPPNREIWEVLHCAKIQLSAIETDVAADPALLEYLSTFRDCQGLTLSPNMGTWACFESAHRFFHNILPGMITTLERLTLIPGAAGPWCFRDELNLNFQLSNILTLKNG
ncbi:hypothetical protein BDQ12DRAFT_129731 [Crucibulum laeve]|uniref:F-box domain-containing protein n=1 Tax=Crucibulum laeve TaxID=68775 RepID=A0A5C3LFT4_9AGAR|nr:hypothetical protein BDQ12DRAFT_129731 [Crucibulum laeve]